MNKINDKLKNVTTFNDLYEITKDMNNKDKGDLFELITYYLFKSSPQLMNGLQEIWMYRDIPSDIMKYLDLPSKDKGIDLLAKINNKYYAIQSKFRQESATVITWQELSTFFGLSFGMNNLIKGGFLVTNTYDLCGEVNKSTKVQAIYGNFFDDNLPDNFFKNIFNNPTEKQLIKYIMKIPFAHQQECITKCTYHYNITNEISKKVDKKTNNTRGNIEMGCGTGKTLTAYWIAKQIETEYDGNYTVIFVPSLYLLSQFYTDWINQSYAEEYKITYLLIGSDADIDEETNYKSNGLMLLTDVTEITKFICDLPDDERLVVICTYQSSDKLAQAASPYIEFDFGIFDEAHKTVGQVGKQFSTMLSNDNLIIHKRLFMTATPKIYGGNLENDDILSMDNEEYYGRQLFCYNTGNAIMDGKLVDYQLVTLLATDADVKELIVKNKLIMSKDEFADQDSIYLATILMLLKKIHDGTCHHMITYHNTVKHAKDFSKFLSDMNELLYINKYIFIDSFNGSTSMSSRNKIIRNFINAKMGILCSARVLNEGVNIPIVDSICFVDTRDSTIDIVQCIGRSLRLYNNKLLAHIFIPTFIKDINDEFDKNVYEKIIRILKAMKSTDGGVTDYFTLKTCGKTCSRKICITERISNIKYSQEIDVIKWNDKIESNMWKIVDPYMNIYNKIREWNKLNKRVPSKEGKDIIEKQLGIWCCGKRKDKKAGKLDDAKIKQLESLSGWYWKKDNPYNNNLTKIQDWININKQLPSARSTNIIEKQLSTWCSNMKQDKKDSKLNDTQIKQLESLPGWYWEKDEKFYNKCPLLREWININKRDPSQHSSDNIEKYWGRWCCTRRKEKKAGKLDDAKIKQLESLPRWFWSK
ncbi:MAG: superfamily II helicase [Faunusvirus sp.]|jgi:predicted helicase|uniref:Superfamily II helicase n=1 Tax=Faunusvirus sp. TaxID=2487766 RepID=A0A3G4ZW48_9VIRU|nr:MAG: superfamily II helicase [Faunusvirus sp.]